MRLVQEDELGRAPPVGNVLSGQATPYQALRSPCQAPATVWAETTVILQSGCLSRPQLGYRRLHFLQRQFRQFYLQ